jgi:hypothetical protein
MLLAFGLSTKPGGHVNGVVVLLLVPRLAHVALSTYRHAAIIQCSVNAQHLCKHVLPAGDAASGSAAVASLSYCCVQLACCWCAAAAVAVTHTAVPAHSLTSATPHCRYRLVLCLPVLRSHSPAGCLCIAAAANPNYNHRCSSCQQVTAATCQHSHSCIASPAAQALTQHVALLTIVMLLAFTTNA